MNGYAIPSSMCSMPKAKISSITGQRMKISDCGHMPKAPAKPRSNTCEECEVGSYPADENSFLWCYEHNDYLEKPKK